MIIDDLATLTQIADDLKASGRSIVFTNGVFDILHAGHVTYLEQARALGDVLIVGVNTDASVHRLKGPTRPINALADRLVVLNALRCVDHTIAFDEDTPINVIRALLPTVLVKGGDYTRDTIVGADDVEAAGGQVVVIPLLEGRSTTGIINRAQKA
jgi:D-beta-D-heptose 7-phosphate kinase / D-beta-D-heptose 1-phosphate adenosyltransferase